jgi:hypothetical protein
VGTSAAHGHTAGEVAFDNVSEGVDSLGIELAPGPTLYLFERLLDGAPSPVRTIAGDRVKGICHR